MVLNFRLSDPDANKLLAAACLLDPRYAYDIEAVLPLVQPLTVPDIKQYIVSIMEDKSESDSPSVQQSEGATSSDPPGNYANKSFFQVLQFQYRCSY